MKKENGSIEGTKKRALDIADMNLFYFCKKKG